MTMRQGLSMIAALTPSRVIGKDNGIPWHYPEDMKHFRRVTRGHALIMGRATFDSIGKPLPKRRNIVITRQRGLAIEGCEVVHGVAEAIELAHQSDAEPCVIGGAQIYLEALPHATVLHLTYLHADHEGDTFFPELPESEWVEVERREAEGLSFVTLRRASADRS